MTAKKKTTPEYTRKAIERYNAKFDRVAVNLPKGTAALIREHETSVNGYIVRLVREDLTRRGLIDTEPPDVV